MPYTEINKYEFSSIGKEKFDILYQISKRLNSSSLQENLIDNALDLIIEVIDAERAVFAKYESENDDFTIVAARNIQKETIKDLSEFSSGILQKVINEKQPCLYHDVLSDPNVSQFQSLQIHNIKSVIGVPIMYMDAIWGVILADTQKSRALFSDENLQFLDFFSNLVSLALDKVINLEAVQKENVILKNQLQATQKIPDMIGESEPMRKLASLIHKVAPTDATILLQGESGTGKDLVARAIHTISSRKDNPYLAQFCGSIPDTLLESELFGYKKGAFTGATADKKGLFEVAENGSFFLDEIADISPALQAKLLRVLQNKEIIRLGGTQIIHVNVRIITATNKDLKQLSKEGKFREDLFYRLNVFPIVIPPLRERKDDIPLLVEHFIKKYGKRQIAPDSKALKKLRNYYWPGNVRQLENVIQRALIMCDGEKLLPDHIFIEEENDINAFDGTLKDFEKLLLTKRLKECKGNRTQTAQTLGVSTRWVQMKIKEMNIEE